jgi:hypothetical protein
MTVAGRHNPYVCEACLTPSVAAGDNDDGLCPGCRSVFRAAKILLLHESVTEEELIPTLAFARIAGLAEVHDHSSYARGEEAVLSGNHPALEITKFLDRVPVVEVKLVALSAERHLGTQFLKSVRIETLSKRVKSTDVAKSYQQLLKREGARCDENIHGDFSYDCLLGYLELTVREGTQLSPSVVEDLGEDLFRLATFQFPPPEMVEGVHEAMQKNFAHRLDLYGERARRPTADKLVPAFVAWHVGSGDDKEVPLASRQRAKTVLNRLLLKPCGLTQLGENASNSAETVWRDVERHRRRFISIQQYASFPSHRL